MKENIKNLSNSEAIQKLKDIAKATGVCMLQTFGEDHPPFDMRPMSPADIDDQGNIWFFSKRSSAKNLEILHDNHVQIAFINGSRNEVLSIYGNAEIINDSDKFEELWDPFAKAWFPQGKEDPELSLIKVQPVESYYWDTLHNKMIAFFKMAAAYISGKEPDNMSREGELKI